MTTISAFDLSVAATADNNQDPDEGKKLDSGVKKFLMRVMEKRKRWMSGA